jgi:hypothetical protein
MAPYQHPHEKPPSVVLPATVIALSVLLGLYAILALPGAGNSNRSLWIAAQEMIRSGDTLSFNPSRSTKPETLRN